MNYVDEAPAQGQPHGQAAGQPPPKKSAGGALVIVAVVGVVLVVVVGILAALAIFGMSRYMQRSKQAEGFAMTPQIARAVAECGAPLPPTSLAVPPATPRGTKYMSSSAEWDQPAFTCGAGFSMSMPQYFSYQWQRTSDTEGSVIGLSDMNADGEDECRIEVKVTCPSSPSTACTTSLVSADCDR